jgi:methyl-accepting chemotaxis protein
MEAQQTVFIANNLFMIISGGLGFLLILALGMLFLVSRKSQRVMQSMLDIMLRPESARIGDATRVLNTIMAEEIAKIEHNFKTMCDTLDGQIAHADELKQALTVQNENLITLADNATKNWPRCLTVWTILWAGYRPLLILNHGTMSHTHRTGFLQQSANC